MSKIAFVESAQNFGGARIAVLQMAKVLSKRHDVFIVDFYGSCTAFVNACRQLDIRFKILLEGSNPYYIKSSSSRIKKIFNVFTYIPHLLKMNNLLLEYLYSNDIDYVCVSGFRPIYCLLFNKPKIEILFFAHGWYLKSQISRLNKFALKYVPDRIVCISEATRQSIFNNQILPLEKLLVVHNYVDEKSLTCNIANIPDSDNCIKIMLCGAFIAGKGHHVAVEIAKVLKNRSIKFKMILAGLIYQGNESRRYFERIERDIYDSNLRDDIVLVVNKSNVHDYIRSCDIVIHPSSSEGFPLAILEAQTMKKPVIANAVGGVIDMIQHFHTGFLTRYNDVDQYVELILRLCHDRDLYASISKNAYELVIDCFSKQRQEEDIEGLFIE